MNKHKVITLDVESGILGTIRTVQTDKDNWCCAEDVCKMLDINDVNEMLSEFEADEKADFEYDGKTMTFIDGPTTLYLIATSDKKEAREYTRWLTHDILPAMRKLYTNSVSEIENEQNMVVRRLKELGVIKYDNSGQPIDSEGFTVLIPSDYILMDDNNAAKYREAHPDRRWY